MFDPTAFIVDGHWGYICCRTGKDYTTAVPKHILWNPLRWQIGVGRGRPCRFVFNRGGRAYRKLSDFWYGMKLRISSRRRAA